MRFLGTLLCCLLLCLPVGLAAQTSKTSGIDKTYANAAAQIVGSAMVESTAYEKLEYLADRIGNRLSGSPQLDEAITWAQATMKADGLDSVRAEPAMVTHWVRGAERCELLSPRKQHLSILGLGNSIGTPAEGITAEVVAVRNFEELEALKDAVKGKIVLYNYAMRTDVDAGQAYGDAVAYRSTGASRAAAQGAVAVLVRSVTTHSLSTPHTGAMRYLPNIPQIPAASVTVEEAELLYRLAAGGEKVVVRLNMEAQMLPDVPSANVIGEVRGREFPDEVVVIGAHLDSWDVGNGASDDGAGCVMVMEAARILKKLHLQPRRTIRVVLYTNEENGLKGGIAYGETHKAEISKHIAAIECDSGAAHPHGFTFLGKDRGFAIVQQIAPLLHSLNADLFRKGDHAGADISVLTTAGVPGLGLNNDQAHYFDTHHTQADTLDKINRVELSQSVAAVAVMAYVLADLPEPLPRD